MTSDKLEVTELDGALPPATREAALRYADADADAARSLLESAIAADSGARRDWLMLLDLERLQRRWRSYETLVARYRIRFGEEPPTERERLARESDLPEELRMGGTGCVSLGGALDAQAMHAMVAIRTAATRHTVVHLDVARVESVDMVGSRLLASAINDLVDAGNGIVLTGTDHLVRLLHSLGVSQPSQKSAWDLLLLLRRLDQDRTAFERDAAEFALLANVDPPAWEPLLLPQPTASGGRERRTQPRYGNREVLELAGVVVRPDDPQMAAAARFAGEADYVNLNLSRLERISLPAATSLSDIVSAASGAGHTVRLIRPNQLVGALLEILNLGTCAAIVMDKV